MKKVAMSQAAWACMNGLVQDARVESHRIHQLLGKVLKAIESLSDKQKEVAYQIAGDLINNIPDRIDVLENRLDVLSYALSIFGRDHMKERLSVSDRALVESALESAPDLRMKKEAKMRNKDRLLKLAKKDPKFRRSLIAAFKDPSEDQYMKGNWSSSYSQMGGVEVINLSGKYPRIEITGTKSVGQKMQFAAELVSVLASSKLK